MKISIIIRLKIYISIEMIRNKLHGIRHIKYVLTPLHSSVKILYICQEIDI